MSDGVPSNTVHWIKRNVRSIFISGYHKRSLEAIGPDIANSVPNNVKSVGRVACAMSNGFWIRDIKGPINMGAPT